MLSKFREGDFIETLDGNIFDVKGLVHPPGKVIAFIRYTPDQMGDRKRGNVIYKKVYSLHKRYELLQKRFPQYLNHDVVFNEWLCEVPINAIRHHYKSESYLRELRRKRHLTQLEAAALHFTEILKKNAEIPWNKLGISGSLLAGLHTLKSDIDIIAYGSQNGCKLYNSLKTLVNTRSGQIKSYNIEDLKRLFDFRSKDTIMSFEDFVRTESRKLLQGTFEGIDYFIRLVKDWNEIDEQYGTVKYQSVGYAKIKARVIDDSQMIFTPCYYKIGDVKVIEGPTVKPIREIVSFRGRFCEQARDFEFVLAQGKLERIKRKGERSYYRLLLGNKVSDYMIITKES